MQSIRAQERRLDDVTRNYIKKYYLAMEGLIPARNRVMHSRPLEFDDLSRVTDLAHELAKSHRALWANLRTTLRTLERDPEFVTTLNIPDTLDETAKLLHNLPPVEFDDTGFIGRERELTELKRALAGSYPVVTVVGEGGLGKTALALKACYDLLDDPDSKLDAIVWTTAKATKLTINEIQTIEGAISTSLGIIESATTVLGRQSETLALDDLLLHLANNNVLLVIDNLETVMDNTIRTLVRSIPTGSRILFTTRIGLGAFDFPITLSPLQSKEATFFFRKAAKVWGVNDLASSPQNVVEGFCNKLQNNPLFIKWFIQSVRAGKRPTALTTDPTVLLRFCLQNVFNSLPPGARAVASTLAGVSGSQTVASLAFFTDLDSIGIQSALSHLITSSLVLSERGRSSEDEERYLLSPLARLYIQKFIRPSIAEQKKLIVKQNVLRSAQDEISARAGTDIFDINYVYARDKDDYIIAKILSRAIELIFKRDLVRAETEVDKAKDLSPNYFEVHRVKAHLHIAQEDYFSAEAAYETAISLAPERPPLRLWYGGFLSRQLGDQERALEQLLEAEKLAPTSSVVKLECARVLQYQRRFEEANGRLTSIQEIDKQTPRVRRVHLDLTIQNYVRHAEHLCTQQDFDRALECLESAKRLFDESPSVLFDARTMHNITRCRRVMSSLRRAFRGDPGSERIEEIERWLAEPDIKNGATHHDEERALTRDDDSSPMEGGSDLPPNRGRLSYLHLNYGFVDTGGARLFFHRSNWMGRGDFTILGEGTIVEFEVGRNDKGACAVNVRPIDDSDVQSQSGGLVLGAIKSITSQYGFIKLDRGGDLFFHRVGCAPDTPFRKLVVGDRVRCRIGKGTGDRACGLDVQLYSGV